MTLLDRPTKRCSKELCSAVKRPRRESEIAYYAARSDVVGQCRRSIEALLPLFYEKAATPDMIRLGLELERTTTECLNKKNPIAGRRPNTL